MKRRFFPEIVFFFFFTPVKLKCNWLRDSQNTLNVFHYDCECTSNILGPEYTLCFEVNNRKHCIWTCLLYLCNKFSSCLICVTTAVLSYCPLTCWWESLFKWQLWTSVTKTVATLGIQGKTLVDSQCVFFLWVIAGDGRKAQFCFKRVIFLWFNKQP